MDGLRISVVLVLLCLISPTQEVKIAYGQACNPSNVDECDEKKNENCRVDSVKGGSFCGCAGYTDYPYQATQGSGPIECLPLLIEGHPCYNKSSEQSENLSEQSIAAFPQHGECLKALTSLTCKKPSPGADGTCECPAGQSQIKDYNCEPDTTAPVLDAPCNPHPLLSKCFPVTLTCDPQTSTCRCLGHRMEYFTTHADCRQALFHDGVCNPSFDLCSPKKALICSSNRKCECPARKDWSDKKQLCLLSISEPCTAHDACVTGFCKANACTRQEGHGRPCKTGENEECSSGLCEKGICQYRKGVGQGTAGFGPGASRSLLSIAYVLALTANYWYVM